MELIRSKHFISWYQKMYVSCVRNYRGITQQAAEVDFLDTFNQETNELNFMLNGIFSNTRYSDEDGYVFITKDDFIHTEIKTHEIFKCGRMSMRIDYSPQPIIFFDNPNFRHGQIYRDTGKIKCWGGFQPFADDIRLFGLATGLLNMYNFARVSNHDTVMLGQEVHT